MTVAYVGSESMPPDGYLRPKRYRITAVCLHCEKEFHWTATSPGGPDRACPRRVCKAAALEERIAREVANRTKMFEEQRAPGIIGDKPIVKAIDTTADIVMTDHHLTDLKDNIREGESMAPKLPQAQQHAADEFFSGKAVMEQAGLHNRQAQLMGRRAIAGHYRGMAISPTVAGVGRQPGDKALRSLGKIS
jgi:hypothetical protein